MKATGLRLAAFGIAFLAVVDPALTSSRPSRPFVAVLSSAADGNTLTDRVKAAIDRRFTVVRGPSDAAAATVVVGDAVPDELRSARGAVVAVLPQRMATEVRITRVEAPASGQLDARVPVEVHVAARGARGRRLEVTLHSGDTVIDQVTDSIAPDSGVIVSRLSFVPSAGPTLLRVSARVSGNAASDSTFTLVDVRDQRLAILFFDARPSWGSTFVRRALEGDPRFSVTHRVVTSRGLSNTGGAAPASLRDLEPLRAFTTIVVGAPDQLSAADVAGLEAFMRRRGGRVILLMDSRSPTAIDRLTGVTGWRYSQTTAPVTVGDLTGREALRARDIIWPAITPTGVTIHAASFARDSTSRPIIWSVPVGAGRLMVSGAIDAWHHRDASSGFDAFWTSIIAAQGAAAPPPVGIEISRNVLAPGDEVPVHVTVRDAFLSDRSVNNARTRAAIVSDVDSTPVRLWPASEPGVFRGTIVAPRRSGTYRLSITSDDDRADIPLMVDPRGRPVRAEEHQLLGAFVSSRGGTALAEADISGLSDHLGSALQVVSRVETWYPMRSPWWIVPFALLLGSEWWWRRRHGQA